MVQRSEAMEIEIRKLMKGGKGQVEITHVFTQEQFKGKCRFCARMLLKPGSSIGLHRHDDEEEVFYIISGEGVVDDNGVSKTVKAGDAILTGNGASHSIENTGSCDLEIFAFILLY